MTMYLSNRDVRPTGYEAGEFLDAPIIPPAGESNPGAPDTDDQADETGTP